LEYETKFPWRVWLQQTLGSSGEAVYQAVPSVSPTQFLAGDQQDFQHLATPVDKESLQNLQGVKLHPHNQELAHHHLCN
jgi:hypothetical protein